MGVWQAVFLGVVQGLTEFLPVSSSGHLVLLQRVLGVHTAGITFEVTVHVATLAAVCAYYMDDIISILKSVSSAFLVTLNSRRLSSGRMKTNPWDDEGFKMGIFVLIGTIPAAVVGIWGDWALSTIFESPTVAGIGLVITGTVLWFLGRPRRSGFRPMSFLSAVIIGCAQAVAIIPGISRSGATISAGLAAGLRRREAARFSFLLSIPAILGAAVLDIPNLIASDGTIPFSSLLAGFVSAGVTGYFAIRIVIMSLDKGDFRRFAYYTWVIGILSLFLVLFS